MYPLLAHLKYMNILSVKMMILSAIIFQDFESKQLFVSQAI